MRILHSRPFAWMSAVSFSAALMTATFAADSNEIRFDFSGLVLQKFSDPFGAPIMPFSTLQGHFIFDTNSDSTHSLGDCDCLGYRQQIVGGFAATFAVQAPDGTLGSVHIRSDDFVVEVRDNFPQEFNGTFVDLIMIRFASDYSPSLSAPLNVAGVEHSNGQFTLAFVGESSLFSGTDLPTDINLNDTPADFNRLSDTLGFVDVLFNISSLESSTVLRGDYNNDGDIDGADRIAWQSRFGSTGDLSADGNRNGIVDAADFVVWRDAAQSVSVAVPETKSGLMWVFGLWVIYQTRNSYGCQPARRHR